MSEVSLVCPYCTKLFTMGGTGTMNLDWHNCTEKMIAKLTTHTKGTGSQNQGYRLVDELEALLAENKMMRERLHSAIQILKNADGRIICKTGPKKHIARKCSYCNLAKSISRFNAKLKESV